MARPHRLPDWQDRLHHLVAQQSRRSFAYGQWDCALFVAAAVEAVTGRDVRPSWSYGDRVGGLRRMRGDGFRDHVAYFQALFPRAPDAAPGDIAVMPGRALGVVQGRMVYVLTPEGLGLAPLAHAREVLAV